MTQTTEAFDSKPVDRPVPPDAAPRTPHDGVASSTVRAIAPPARRLAALFDRGHYEEIDALAHHRATGWGMADKRFEGDGVSVAGPGRGRARLGRRGHRAVGHPPQDRPLPRPLRGRKGGPA